MKLVKVTEEEKVIVKRTAKKDLISYLNQFEASGDEIVKVEFTENDYKNALSARSCFSRAIITHKFNMNVRMRNGNLYLVKVKEVK